MKQEELTVKFLHILHKNPYITQRKIAKSVGISLGKTNYIIKELTKKGVIKASRFLNSKNKRAYTYILTPKGVKEKTRITKNFVKRKIAEYEKLLESS
ncbi:MAG: MarR family EPS-associated transcriptional regulator [Candidatus Omnitrophota bacterium]|nr:MAG: MarR family EPS-associated transcriptional regulator [Candidatus Omnitrophota bacterium]